MSASNRDIRSKINSELKLEQGTGLIALNQTSTHQTLFIETVEIVNDEVVNNISRFDLDTASVPSLLSKFSPETVLVSLNKTDYKFASNNEDMVSQENEFPQELQGTKAHYQETKYTSETLRELENKLKSGGMFVQLTETSNFFQKQIQKMGIIRLYENEVTAGGERDKFYNDIEKKVLLPLLREIDRIAINNPQDIRIKPLTEVRNIIDQAIKTSQSGDPDNQVDLKERCRNTISSAIQEKLIDNKALDENWGVKIGKALLNAIIAIPVVIRSLVSEKKVGDSFYSFKKKTHDIVKDIKTDLDKGHEDNDKVTPAPKGP